MVNRYVMLFLFGMILPEVLSTQSLTLGGTVKDSYTKSGIDSVRIEISSLAEPNDRFNVHTAVNGAWSFTFQPADIHPEAAGPHSFELQQNFPNPFNPSTTIPFSLPSAGTVTIVVHNILGQLLDERSYTLPAGQHQVRWNAKGAAGTLFYTLRYNRYSETRKMIQTDGGGGSGLGGAVLTGGVARTMRKTNASDYRIIFAKFGYETDSVIVPPVSNPAVDRSMMTIHRRAFVMDLHNDVAELMVTGYQLGIRHTSNQSDLPRFFDGGVDAQMIVLWPDPGNAVSPYQQTIQMYDTCMAQFGRNSASIVQARTSAEIQSVNAAGKLAAVLCVEGGIAIEEDIAKLLTFYQLGARYLTITWNNSTSWGTSAADPLTATKGLSEFGKQVIRTMDSLGMIIDVSHTGIKTIEDILNVTKNPIIASHSGARALRNHTRNLTNDQITAIANTGGVIGVVFYTSFISTASAANVNIDTVIKHIDHIKNLVGIDHVAIGSDYDGGITAPVGLENVSKLQNLTMALLRKGYSPADVRKILGGNYLRVFKAVCK